MAISKSDLMKMLRSYFQFGFHLSRKSWELLELSTFIGTPSVETAASEVYTLRRLADRINEKRMHSSQLPQPIQGGQLTSVSVLTDILRYVVELYCHQENPGIISRGLDWTGVQRGQAVVIQPPPSFIRLFPPVPVLAGQQSENEYMQTAIAAPHSYDTIVREIVLLFLATANPAFKPFRMLFDDTELKTESPYVPMVQGLEGFFATQPPFSLVGLTLFECLYAPMRAAPDSLEGQLDYVRRHWAHFLPLELLERLLLAVDILEEERTLRGLGPGPHEALRFDRDVYGTDLSYAEPAAFSRDADWMSNVVLIAKTVYVWLFQLSKKYQRDIRLLSDIPDEELDQLARWGFTGLWLIGVWERSTASQKIKQIMGNPEAASSAYSLYDYFIAADLGGEEAFQNLKARAWQRGIRLTSDMVPNHMGIYSKWVIEHPNWFLQSSYPPFPVYQFTGVDLSEDPRVCIQIEDGYWQHRDAAVVFKRIDKYTGDVKYIYHGNDGTSMPWNDTAQLNFLLPEVREAVIQTILQVARRFPIIRFDAAMTLAKRHYQRLWFPLPGEGGAIPSRAEHGITKAHFDSLVPKEFWREVVDRVTAELPETLLLAEAFWLMEGYFVRTLGMHRVYNSAFMNMLKMEENAKYRTTIKNVLEFSPEVIMRFVNFMNNPDERTAVDQFGRGDKYYGVAMMMVTMPGLPMFGHGQIDGFTEKYGMEYRRSYWDEQVDWEMVHRHERQIFPLMRRRYLFSGAHNFALYDFVTPGGWVDENVFAYTNRVGNERAVILYNNAYNTTSGGIHTSTQINVGDADQPAMVRRNLAEALELNIDDNCFYAFRDYQSGLEYIRNGRHLATNGIFAELHGYQYHAFLDFREIIDRDGSWRKLEQSLSGAGVENIDETYREQQYESILKPYRQIMNATILQKISVYDNKLRDELRPLITGFYESIDRYIGADTDIKPLVKRFISRFEELPPKTVDSSLENITRPPENAELKSEPAMSPNLDHLIFSWLTLESLGEFRATKDNTPSHILMIDRADKWLLSKVIREAFEGFLTDNDAAYWDSILSRILVSHPNLLVLTDDSSLGETFRRALVDTTVRDYLEIHKHEEILWLNKERLERMIGAMAKIAAIIAPVKSASGKTDFVEIEKRSRQILESAAQAGYQVEKLLAHLE